MSGRGVLIAASAAAGSGFVLTLVFLQYGRLDLSLLTDAIRYCF